MNLQAKGVYLEHKLNKELTEGGNSQRGDSALSGPKEIRHHLLLKSEESYMGIINDLQS
jgi:hypothetical protein